MQTRTELELAPASLEQAAVVISQVYGGGGNSGSYWQNDFIELFNRSAAAVNLAGWSVQYASANDSYWQVTPLNGVLEPGGYYLVQLSGGTGGSAALPAPDALGVQHMATASGKVALSSTLSPLSGSNPLGSPALIDLVGYGATNGYEGSGPVPVLANTTAAFRKDGGCTDTNDNVADFVRASPQPRNSQSPRHLCYLSLPPQSQDEPLAPAPAAPALQAPVRLAIWDFESATLMPVSGSGTASRGSGLGSESFVAGNGSSSAWSFSHWGVSSTLSADKYVEFTTSTLGYGAISLHLEERRSGTGPLVLELAYSTDGSSFTPFTVRELPNDTNWRGQSFDFSAVPELDNRERVTLRLYGYGASGTTGTWRFDNVIITASARTPEAREENTAGIPEHTDETIEESMPIEVEADVSDVCGAPFTPIYALSGTGAVVTEGVVTADFWSELEGFFIKDPLGDGDPNTSDGIFVSLDAGSDFAVPSVGEQVRVRAELGAPEGVRQLYGISLLLGCGSVELGQAPAAVPAEPPAAEEVLEPDAGDDAVAGTDAPLEEASAPAFDAREAIAGLINEVIKLRESNVLNRGQSVSLVAKLQNALSHLEKHEGAQVEGLLQAFINEARALTRGRTLSEAQAVPLIAAAETIMGGLK